MTLFKPPPTGQSAAMLVLTSLMLIGTSCKSDDDQAGDGPGAGTASLFVDIAFDQPSASLGSSFNLRAVVVGGEGDVDLEWTLPDDVTATGSSVDFVPESVGVQSIELRGTDASGDEFLADSAVLVFPEAGSGNSLLGVELSDVTGDVDGDGTLSLKDCLAIARAVDGTEPFQTASELNAADVWVDGIISELDYSLASRALDDGASAPTVAVPASGSAGRVVTVFAPALDDRDAIFTAQIGAGFEAPVQRAVLGRGAIVVDEGLPLGATEIVLRRDGAIVTSIPFEIVESVPLTGEPGALFQELMNLEAELTPLARSGFEQYLSSMAVVDDGQLTLLALWDEAQSMLVSSRVEFQDQLNALPPGALRLMERYAVANGMLEQIQRGRSLMETARNREQRGLTLDDVALETLCILSAFKGSSLPTVGGYVSTACDYGGTAAAVVLGIVAIAGSATGVVPAAALAVLTGIVATCTAAAGPVAVIEVVSEMAPDMRLAQMRVVADPPVLDPPMTVESMLSVRLTVPTDQTLCAGGGTLRDKIVAKAVKKVLTKTPLTRNIFGLLKTLPKNIEEQISGAIVSAVSSALGTIVSETEVAMQLDSVGGYLCALGTSVGVGIDPNGVLMGPIPATAGTLELPAAGSGLPAIYTCDVAGGSTSGSASFQAMKSICSRVVQAQTSVSCGVRPVTITMGDNGSLNDDIFSVEVDGVSVLTSTVPVRMISETIELSIGQHSVVMRGLAAPDGVGTYFIEFDGATVVSGDPLTGTDLTPGTSKSFVISVAN